MVDAAIHAHRTYLETTQVGGQVRHVLPRASSRQVSEAFSEMSAEWRPIFQRGTKMRQSDLNL